ncbi:MAG: anion permease [Campylobacteraceae bacterium]|jgi:citrate:succinate antiporter/L-tartrate/succinate antiporter|nr:anion permease [Campylobacteraceae bacterium]
MKSYVKLLIPILIGIAVFLFPTPEGVNPNTWLYFSIFAGVIVGLILEPIPAALIGFIGITVAVLCGVGPAGTGVKSASADVMIKWALTGFSNKTVWLIFAAFMIGIGYQNSGLGKRIALLLVKKLGKSTIGLGYAISITDGILAPFIPSNAARSGGTLYPIITSIPPMFGSYPDKDSRKIGAYLAWCALAATCVSSSIFLTGQAPNPLALQVAAESGVNVVDWGGWLIAFLPVSIILFIATPLLAYFIYPPEIKGSTHVVEWAAKETEKIGKISLKEIFMISISICALVLWIGSGFFGVDATTTAIMVIIAMLACKIISWNDFLGNKPAWNVLVWFGTLVTLAGGLKNVGFLDWVAQITGGYLNDFSPLSAMIGLVLIFYFIHYFFASGTAHVTALLAVFITMASTIPGVDVQLVTLLMVLPMGLMGVLTPYGTGHSPVWFASGYVKTADFWRLGCIFGVFYIAVYLLVGIPWITNFAYDWIF